MMLAWRVLKPEPYLKLFCTSKRSNETYCVKLQFNSGQASRGESRRIARIRCTLLVAQDHSGNQIGTIKKVAPADIQDVALPEIEPTD